MTSQHYVNPLLSPPPPLSKKPPRLYYTPPPSNGLEMNKPPEMILAYFT